MTTAVIIPVRNRPALVEAAIRSCQSQSERVDEIIVVDDASTDETPLVIERLAEDDSRIRLLRQTVNLGANHARNLGAQSTQAEWLAFLDSDDQWLRDKLRLQCAALSQAPDAIACFTGIRYLLPVGSKDEPLLKQAIDLDELRLMNFLGSTSTAIVQRRAFEAVGGFDVALPSCQDWDLWLRLREIGPFTLVSEPLILYDQTDQGRISKNLDKVLQGHRAIFDRVTFGLTWRHARRVRAYHQIRLAQIYLWDFRMRRSAAAASLRSLLYRPSKMGAHQLYQSLRSFLPH